MSVSFTSETGVAAFTATPEMPGSTMASAAPAAASTVAKPRQHLADLRSGSYSLHFFFCELPFSVKLQQAVVSLPSVSLGRNQITPPEWKLDESAICGPEQHQDSPILNSVAPQSDQTSFGLLPQECLAQNSEGARGQNTFWTTLPCMQQTTSPQLASVSEV